MKEKLILLVDDEKKITEVVTSYLVNKGYKVFSAFTGKEALDVFSLHKFSLVILDLMLPDISGEEVCKRIRKISRVPVIMLTAKADETNVLQGFDLGADDYVVKPFSPRQLVARVEALFRRTSEELNPLKNYFSFNNDDIVVNDLEHQVKVGGKIVNLTPNEYKILLALISYPLKVFSREEIIKYAFDNNFSGFDRTIDVHIKNLRKKIETNPNNPRYIFTVHGVGYCFKEEIDKTET